MNEPDTLNRIRDQLAAVYAAKGWQMGQPIWRQGDEGRTAAYEADLLIKATFHGQLEVLLAASASAAALQCQRQAIGAN